MKKEYGVIGLGRMGGNLARQALKKGIGVVGYEIRAVPEDLKKAGLVDIKSLADFKTTLERPRAIFIYVPAGPLIDQILDDCAAHLEPGDILVDGGNSYWGDSIRRAKRLKEKGIHLVDLGTSGGVDGALNGACFMVGGEKDAVARIEPILKDLAIKDGYVYAGPPGAGHFTKLVHNGIEFGMLQSIGEGMDLLEHYKDKLDVAEILKCWRHGSVIRSWLIDLMEAEYRKQGSTMEKVPSHVEDTGEVNWLIGDALRMEVPIPVIAASVMQLFQSRDTKKSWARAIAMMRHGFGGHPYGPDDFIVSERKMGRVGDIYRGDEEKK